MQQEVCWPADRLHAECSGLRQELERLQSSMHSSSNARTVADVDNELEALESERRNAEMRKDNLLQRQNRLRCAEAAFSNTCNRRSRPFLEALSLATGSGLDWCSARNDHCSLHVLMHSESILRKEVAIQAGNPLLGILHCAWHSPWSIPDAGHARVTYHQQATVEVHHTDDGSCKGHSSQDFARHAANQGISSSQDAAMGDRA